MQRYPDRMSFATAGSRVGIMTVFVSGVLDLVFYQTGSVNHNGHKVNPEEDGSSVAVQGTADLVKNRKGWAIIFHNH